jgi:hypothetical protein
MIECCGYFGEAVGIIAGMSAKGSSLILDRLVDPLSQCLTPEVARRVLNLRADPKLQAIIDALAEKSDKGILTLKEQAEYANYVSFGTFVALLKSKSRQLLANSSGLE